MFFWKDQCNTVSKFKKSGSAKATHGKGVVDVSTRQIAVIYGCSVDAHPTKI
jgi:hypothetical protein